MRTEQRLYGSDIRILKDLFDLALKKYGITDKSILDVSSKVRSKLRDSINDFATLNKEKAKEFDVELQIRVIRTYAVYVSNIRSAIERAGGIDKVQELVKETDDGEPYYEGLPYSYPIINTLTAYATQGKYFEWEKYRSKQIEALSNLNEYFDDEVSDAQTEFDTTSINEKTTGDSAYEENESVPERRSRSWTLFVLIPIVTVVMNLISYLITGYDFINMIGNLFPPEANQDEWIKGEVRFDGIPITNAIAKLGPMTTQTDSLGGFEFQVPNPKKDSFYLVEISKSGFKTYSFRYMLDDSFLNIILLEPKESTRE